MKKYLQVILLSIVFIVTSQDLHATHLLGSDISWECIGKDSFLVTLNLYRDCNGAPIGNADLVVSCATSGVVLFTKTIAIPSPVDITPTCASSCSRCQSASCAFPYGIEKYKYQGIIDLGSYKSCCKVRLSYSNCCRNSTITTGAANANFYTTAVLDHCLVPENTSPQYFEEPLNIICIGQDVELSFGGTNMGNSTVPDYSIKYSLVYPKSGQGANIPYTGQYDYDKPIYFWGFPNTKLPVPRGFRLNENNGVLSFRSMKLEQTVMAVEVEEYSGTNLISRTRRDMQIIVINCPSNHSPFLNYTSSNTQLFFGDTLKVAFTSNDYDSDDTVRFSWSENLPGAIIKTNNDSIKHPYFDLTWVPDSSIFAEYKKINFIVRVTDDACPVQGTQSVSIEVSLCYDKIEFKHVDESKQCGRVELKAYDPNISNPYYFWDLGSYGQYQDSSFSVNLPYGNYPYQVWAEHVLGCSKVYYDTIKVDSTDLSVSLPQNISLCYGENYLVEPIFYGLTGNTSYIWSNGDTSKNLMIDSFSSLLNLSMILQDTHCTFYSDTIQIEVGEDLLKQQRLDICETDPAFKVQLNGSPDVYTSSKSGVLYQAGYDYYFNPSYAGEGRHVVYAQELIGTKWCFDSLVIRVYGRPLFSYGETDFCRSNGFVDLNSIVYPSGGVWNIDSLSLKDTGTFKKTYTYQYPNTNCSFIDSVYFSVRENPNTSITYPPDRLNICVQSSNVPLIGNPSGGIWYGPDGSVVANKFFDPGVFDISQSVPLKYVFKNNFGCMDSSIVYLNLKETPKVNAYTSNGIYEFCKKGKIKVEGSPNGGKWVTNNISQDGYFDLEAYNGINKVQYYYIDSFGCKASDTFYITVHQLPTADFMAYPTTGSGPLTVYFTNLSSISSPELLSYNWDFGDGKVSSGKNPQHQYVDSGSYAVSLIAKSEEGCRDTITKQDYIYLYKGSSSIDGQFKHAVSVIYDKSQDKIRIQCVNENVSLEAVELHNVAGNLIYRSGTLKNEFYVEVGTAGYSRGIYMLSIFTSDQRLITHKLNIFD